MSKHAEVEALLDWVWQESKTHTLLTGFTPNVVILPSDMLPKVAAYLAAHQSSGYQRFAGAVTRDDRGALRLFGKEVVWHQISGAPRVLYERDCGPARQKLGGTSRVA